MSQEASTTYVEVAVPAPLLGTLTYRVPASLATAAQPGARVRVPLGTRRVIGIVIRAGAAPDPTIATKDLLAVLDPTGVPALPPDVLATVSWVADYYVAPIGDAARAALPAALSPHDADDDTSRGAPTRRRVVRVAASVMAQPQAALDALSKSPAQRRALEHALRGASFTPADLARAAETSHAAIAALVQRGLLDTDEEELPPSAVPIAEFPVSRPAALSEAQRFAIERIAIGLEQGEFAPFVLYGVTGSGKTEVYLRAAEIARMRGRTALFLVPEIGLTPSLSHALSARFGDDVVVLHSGLTSKQRFSAWERVRQGQARLVVGARSAVFAPLERPGLIVVDEEHDGGFKQEESPRYHARDLALVRGREADAVVVLGSATPSLESWSMAKQGKAELLTLPDRVSGGQIASVRVVDMRLEFQATKREHALSRALIEALQQTTARGEQAIVLLNRRGYTRALMCRGCGLAEGCGSCSISLTWHQVGARLRCHYCGHQRPRPATCSTCGSPHLADVGSGTQRAEEELVQALPGIAIARLDRDTVRNQRTLTDTLEGFARGELQVLVGTQMIAKGHHFPRVTLVGVLSADAALRMPDFRAAERTFQLLTQVAGRAGRGELPGTTIVQAFSPDHPALQAALTQQYEPFAARESAARELLRYPPAAALGLVLVRDTDQARAFQRATGLADSIRAAGEGVVAVLGPTAAPLARLRDHWRVQILVRARRRARVGAAIRAAVHQLIGKDGALPGWLVIDIDPHSLL
ncbi:MAG: primosomal protein N' [Acidobacteriota bacterium]